MKLDHIIRWHIEGYAVTPVPPRNNEYGPREGVTPEDLDHAVGTYLTTPADPVLQRNLMASLANATTFDWPRLA